MTRIAASVGVLSLAVVVSCSSDESKAPPVRNPLASTGTVNVASVSATPVPPPATPELTRDLAQKLISASPLFTKREEYDLEPVIVGVTGITKPSATEAQAEFAWKRVKHADDISTETDAQVTGPTRSGVAALTLYDDGWRVVRIGEVQEAATLDAHAADLQRSLDILHGRLEQRSGGYSFPGRPRTATAPPTTTQQR